MPSAPAAQLRCSSQVTPVKLPAASAASMRWVRELVRWLVLLNDFGQFLAFLWFFESFCLVLLKLWVILSHFWPFYGFLKEHCLVLLKLWVILDHFWPSMLDFLKVFAWFC